MQKITFHVKQLTLGAALLIVLTFLPIITYAVKDGENGKRGLSNIQEKPQGHEQGQLSRKRPKTEPEDEEELKESSYEETKEKEIKEDDSPVLSLPAMPTLVEDPQCTQDQESSSSNNNTTLISAETPNKTEEQGASSHKRHKGKENKKDQEASFSQAPSQYITLEEAFKRYAKKHKIQNINNILVLDSTVLEGSIRTFLYRVAGGLQVLPEEVWDYILSYLLDDEHFRNASLVCPTFNDLLKSQWMARSLARGITPSKLWELAAPSENSIPLPTLTQCKDKVKDIKIMGVDEEENQVGVIDKDLQSLSQFPNLERLCLDRCSQITGEGFQYLPIHLKELDVNESYSIIDAGLAHMPKLEALTKLRLSWCRRSTDMGMKSLVEKCPNITTLDLKGFKKSMAEGFRVLVENCPKVTTLNLSNCKKISEMAFECFANLSLTKLKLRESLINDEGLKYLHDMPLKVLKLQKCKEINGRGFQYLPSTLTTLDVRHSNITDENLQYLPSTLTTFRVWGPNITDTGLKHLPDTLTVFDIANDNITDAVIQCLPRGLTKLCIQSEHISDEGFKAIMERCPGLTSLILRSPKITGASLKDSPQRYPSLTSLIIERASFIIETEDSSITSRGLLAIVRSCPNLARLSLNLCTRINDFTPISSLSKLERLAVTGTKISQQGLQLIVEKCPKLTTLFFNSNPRDTKILNDMRAKLNRPPLRTHDPSFYSF